MPEGSLDLVFTASFAPAHEKVELARTFLAGAVLTNASADERHRVLLSVNELLENAVRYGTVMDDVTVTLHMDGPTGAFEVAVSNSAVERRIDLLASTLRELDKLEARAGFVDAMRRSQREHQSGIGLARLRSEAQVELDLERGPGRVTVTARGADRFDRRTNKTPRPV